MKALLLLLLAVTFCGCSRSPSGPHADSSASQAATSPTGSSAGAGSSGAAGSSAGAGVAPSASASSPAAPPPAPKVGACYRLSFADATHPTSSKRAVACGKDHTAVTMYVGRLELVLHGHSVGVDSHRAQRQVARSCTARLPGYLGGTPQARQLSRFQVIWFSPTLSQSDAGADWFRCDLVAVGTGSQLMRLPHHDRLHHVLDRPRALSTFGLCGTAQPGSRGFQRVPCAARHAWVAVSTIPLRGGSHYPGVPAVRQAGDRTCADVVRRRTGLALKFQYGWEWPTAAQWRSGQHYGYCWSPS
jgi:hypothetical protein